MSRKEPSRRVEETVPEFTRGLEQLEATVRVLGSSVSVLGSWTQHCSGLA